MTSSVLDKVTEDMKSAMKSKEKERLAALRLIRAALKNAEIEKGSLSQDDILKVLANEAKKRRDTADMYRTNDRPELAEKEELELSVIQEYLPKPLSEDDVRKMISDLISETGASSKKDIGKIMGPMMEKVRGRFDGSKVKDLVMEQLA